MKRVRLEYLEERTLLTTLPILSISNPAPFPEGSTGTSNMVFVVTRSGDTAPALSVHYQTKDGTAVAGVDYVATSGSVSFAANQTTATISVPVIGSTLLKADTTFSLSIQPDITIAGSQSFTVSGFPTSATVVDVNGDGLPDIVNASYGSGGKISVLLNTSVGTVFSLASQMTFSVGSNPTSVKVGDVNGDLLPDIVVANGGAGTVSVLLNTSTGTAVTAFSLASQRTFSVGGSPSGVAIGDVNGDGLLDIVTSNASSNTVSVLLNTSPSTAATAFSLAGQRTFSVGSSPSGVAIGDVNGDLLPDIVTSNASSNNVSVLLNTSPSTAATAFSLAGQRTFGVGSTPKAVALGDVSGDGLLDIVTANNGSNDGTNSVSVLLNTSTGTAATAFGLASQVGANAGANPISVALGDVNGDGLPDIVVSNYTSSSATVVLNARAGTAATSFALTPSHTFPTGGSPRGVALGDLNGDGRLDIVTANYDTKSHTDSVLLNTTTPVTVSNATATGTILNGNSPASVAVSTGAGQSAAVTTGFGTALSVAVKNGAGFLVQGASVTFTAPASGAGGTFAGGLTSVTVTTDANGIATASAFTANTVAGTYSITVSTGSIAPLSISLTNNPGAAASMTLAQGGSQTGLVGQAFATNFAVQLRDAFGNLATQAGVNVTFTAPSPDGSGGTFAGGLTTAVVSTDATGLATAPTFTAGTTIGTLAVTASSGGLSPLPIAIAVQEATTTSIVSSATGPITFGQSVTFTATVAAVAPGVGTPSGTVNFYDSLGNLLGSGTLNGTAGNDQATFTTTSLPVGTTNVKAVYAGDPFNTTSDTAYLSVLVLQATTTSLDLSSNPALTGDPVTLTATVTGIGSVTTPTGYVSFLVNSTILGFGTLIDGVATFTTSTLPTGHNALTAQYLGTTNVSAGSTSSVSDLLVGQAATSTALATTGSTSVLVGQAVTFTATVSNGSGTTTPTGTVAFYNGATYLGSAVTINGVATISTSSLPAGTESVTANFIGSTGFSPSQSAGLPMTVSMDDTSTTFNTSASGPVSAGQAVTLTATVANLDSASNPIGTVGFYLNSSTLLGIAGLVNGVAAFTTASLPVGSLPITAKYLGTSQFAPSTSSASTVVVTSASTPGGPTSTVATSTTVSSSASGSINAGQSVTLTASVSNLGGAATPTGVVLFYLSGTNPTLLGYNKLANGATSITIANMPVGNSTVYAQYLGAGNFAASTSATIGQSVNLAPTTTTVTSSASGGAAAGQAVTFTATVTGPAGLGSSTAGVAFYLNGTTYLGVAGPVNGVATFTTTALPAGANTITAVSLGSSTFAASTSSPLAQQVATASTTTTLTSSAPSGAAQGQTVKFTANVTSGGAGVAKGIVLFTDANTNVVLGYAGLASGVATLATTSLAVGTTSVAAHYLGTSSYAASDSASLSQLITGTPSGSPIVPTATTTTVSSSASGAAGSGDSVTFTAHVTSSGGTPFGSVAFYLNGSTFLGFGTLSGGGFASFTTNLLPVGTNAVTAKYLDTAKFTASTSAPISQAVNAISTTTTITGSPSGAIGAGQTVTFTAHVSSSSGTASPYGYVLFYNGSTPLGFTYLSQGDATFSTTGLMVGDNAITAQYLGTGNLLPSTSAPLSKTVNAATTSTAITSSSPGGFQAGLPVTFTATVTNSTSSTVPTGYVAFFANSTTLLGFGTLVNGVATYTNATLPIGTVAVTAQYLGTSKLAGSTSSAFSQVVNGPQSPDSGTPTSVATTSTSITSAPSGPISFGEGVTYTATVSNLDGAPIPVGTVGFYLNDTIFLGYRDLINGVATLATASLPVGSNNVTARYLGNSKFAQSASAPVAQAVNQVSTTTALASSASAPLASGQSVTFTATVANNDTSTVPTGSVSFYLNGNVWLGSANLIDGVATLSISSLPIGGGAITAQYIGSSGFGASTSSSVAVSVNALQTSNVLTLLTASSIVLGQTAKFSVTVTDTDTGTIPTGTIIFLDGTKLLATVALSNGTATFATSSLGSGVHNFQAIFIGTSKYQGGTSNSVSVSVS